MGRVNNLLYGWSCTEDSLTQFMIGAWWAPKDQRPGGTAVRIHLVPPKNLLREDGLVLDQTGAIVFVHDNVLKPLAEVGEFTDIVFEKKKVTVSLVPAARHIWKLRDPAEKLDLRPWKLEQVEVLPQLARWRFEPLASRVSEWLDPHREPVEKAVTRALKKLKSPGSFEKRAGLDKPKLEVKKVMSALKWLDKELEKFPVKDLTLYLNVHPVQRYVNFSYGAWLIEPVNVALGEHFDFDIEDARRIPAVLWKAGITSAPDLPRIELTDDH